MTAAQILNPPRLSGLGKLTLARMRSQVAAQAGLELARADRVSLAQHHVVIVTTSRRAGNEAEVAGAAGQDRRGGAAVRES
jgi:hypothetical protein